MKVTGQPHAELIGLATLTFNAPECVTASYALGMWSEPRRDGSERG